MAKRPRLSNAPNVAKGRRLRSEGWGDGCDGYLMDADRAGRWRVNAGGSGNGKGVVLNIDLKYADQSDELNKT